MSATVYRPGETWPTHQKQYWRKPLLQARDAGWTLTHLNAHWWGRVACPSGQHTFSVDKTASGAETKAKEAAKRLRNCRCGRAAPRPIPARVAECERLLTRADGLVGDVKGQLARLGTYIAALAEMDRLELLLDTADQTVDDALLRAQEVALVEAAAVEAGATPAEVSTMLDDAATDVDAAAKRAWRVARAETRTRLEGRAEALKQDIAACRQDLHQL